MRNVKWFVGGLWAGLTSVSLGIASVPRPSAVVQTGVSEISAAKELEPNFDGDVNRLAQLETRYQEKLPELRNIRGRARLVGPMKRLEQRKYRSSSRQGSQAK